MARTALTACAAILTGALHVVPAGAQTAPSGPAIRAAPFGPSLGQAAQQLGNDLARGVGQFGASAGRAADAFTRSLNQPYTITIPTQPYGAYSPYPPSMTVSPRAILPQSRPPQAPPRFKVPPQVRQRALEQARANARAQARGPATRWRGLSGDVMAQLSEDQRGLMDAAQDKALDAPIGDEMFWTHEGSSGFVRVVSEDRFGSFACRTFHHSITIDDRESNGDLTACRDTNGGWTQAF